MNEGFELETVSIRLVKDAPLFSKTEMNTPEKAVGVLWKHLHDFDREVICVINLNNRLMSINVNFASVGAVDQALAYPRELFKSSILSNASHMMLLHNHPSGSLRPSEKDIDMTKQMRKLCDMMGIPLLDHIIIGPDRNEYYSFRDNGEVFREHGQREKIADVLRAVASANERAR